MPAEVARVVLWGSEIGAVAWNPERKVAAFEFVREFQSSGLELAPLMMPLGRQVYSFPQLSWESFHGLPGMLADSLPDKFGNLLIDEWLVREGRDPNSFTPIERLCYVGTRGMGALEYRPALVKGSRSAKVDIGTLVELARKAIAEKETLSTQIGRGDKEDVEAMRDILRVGTSAGGARAKAIIAWNRKTGEVRSGQVKAPDGFEYWLLKFDGVAGNRDKEIGDPKGYGNIEYAYYLMAREIGIEMSECRLYRENDRSHFMTRRFDRTDDGDKILMQSLCALGHMDYNQAGAYSYEQAMEIIERLAVPRKALEQLFRRMVLSVLGRNQDDHTKNIAFLMDKQGSWRLAPAFDIIYSYNPDGLWTDQHQMTINGKRDHFALADFYAVAERFRILKRSAIEEILGEVDDVIGRWPQFADQAHVPAKWRKQIAANHRRLHDLR
jgi:serine/threonine-protein kinase HipA